MEAAVGESRAVSGDQQIGSVKVRRVYRDEFYLNRSVGKSAVAGGGAF